MGSFSKVNNFLIELGTGFAYMGREVRITVGEVEKFIDMLNETDDVQEIYHNAELE